MVDLSILLADDDPNIRQLVSINLRKRNFDVREVSDGQQAIDALGEALPDVIVLDMDMPNKTGYEVCVWARAHGIETPILIMTAYSPIDMKILTLQAGANDYLVKPFRIEDFLNRLRALAEAH